MARRWTKCANGKSPSKPAGQSPLGQSRPTSPQSMAATAPQTLDDPFQRALYGMLYGIMRWDQLTQFWAKVDAGAGWDLYAVGAEAPAQPADAQHVIKFMRDLDSLLRREHQEDYCGIVYADNLDQPSFIKIYD